jgi:DNA polymerase III epsilon subunit-like protein
MAVILIFDLETTGLDSAVHKVIEITAYDSHADEKREGLLAGYPPTVPAHPLAPEAGAQRRSDRDVER